MVGPLIAPYGVVASMIPEGALTPEFGHPRLREHLAGVIMLMKAAPNWGRFMASLNRASPKLNATIPLPFDDE